MSYIKKGVNKMNDTFKIAGTKTRIYRHETGLSTLPDYGCCMKLNMKSAMTDAACCRSNSNTFLFSVFDELMNAA